MERGANRANHREHQRPLKGRCCRSCMRCSRVRLHRPGGACRSSPRRSTSRAPKSTASSPSIMTSARAGRPPCARNSAAPRPARPPGGDALAARAEARLGIALRHDTTADGRVTLEPVYCLGLCSVSPSAMIDGKLVGRLDAKEARRASSRRPTDERAPHLRPGRCRGGGAAAPTRSLPRSLRPPPSARSTIEIVRNGSRGMFWLEPMVEVETANRPHRLRPGRAGRCRKRASTR